MNNILPKLDELQPIIKSTNTFYDCGFNKPFSELDFEIKLKVINDIVRQSMVTDVNANISNEKELLIGNCHSSSLILIDYLKELGIGSNYKYVMARGRIFDPDNFTSKHAIVLVDNEVGETYQIDSSPYAGYKFGKVVKLSDEKIYNDYVVLEGELLDIISGLREYTFDIINGSTFVNNELLDRAKSHEILFGFVAYCYKLLAMNGDKSLLINSLEYNKYQNFSKFGFESKEQLLRKKLLLKQIKEWQCELNDLIASKKDYKRQLDLAQWIVQEMRMIDGSRRTVLIDGKNYNLSHITPRLLFDKELNVVIIKASAYHLGVRATIREYILDQGNGAIGEYFLNIAQKNLIGIKPMMFSHPLGYEYERSMNGKANVFMIKENAEILAEKKKYLRNQLAKNLFLKEVMWNDGEPILWHPNVTNLVHSTDDYCEAALHYLIGSPEEQVMTRFMYPNPKLVRKLK